MATKPLLPVHSKNSNLRGSGATKTILRLTEKYVLAIALVAFCLVFLGAFYLPQENTNYTRVKRNWNDLAKGFVPDVGHGEEVHNVHKNDDAKNFLHKVKSDRELDRMVADMEQELQKNQQKIEKLNSRLSNLVYKSKQPSEEKGPLEPVPPDEGPVEDGVNGEGGE